MSKRVTYMIPLVMVEDDFDREAYREKGDGTYRTDEEVAALTLEEMAKMDLEYLSEGHIGLDDLRSNGDVEPDDIEIKVEED